MKVRIVLKQGNMEGLAKHLAKTLGGDPGFFTKCMACDELSSYDEDQRKGICAQAHKLALGHWPSQDADNKKKKEIE